MNNLKHFTYIKYAFKKSDLSIKDNFGLNWKGLIVFAFVYGLLTFNKKHNYMMNIAYSTGTTLLAFVIVRIIIFLWHLIQSKPAIELEKLKNENNKEPVVISANEQYIEYLGILWDFLIQYNYKKDNKRQANIIGLISEHNQYSSTYIKLEKLRIKTFYNKKLNDLLQKFMNYFVLFKEGQSLLTEYYNIKPNFKNKKQFETEKNAIYDLLINIKKELS